ncbi:MAG: elongation factor 1-beta [Candidatus Ranarchaeia archaeon]
MAKVYGQYAVLPVDTEVDLEDLKTRILDSLPSDVEVKQTKIEPVAFGLKKIIISMLMNDEEGKTDSIEQIMRDAEGVQDVSVEGMTLV